MENQYYNISTTSPIRATQAHNTVSEKYQFLSTATVIDRLADYGWFPARVDEARCVRQDKKGFQKHIVRFRHDSYMRPLNDSIPEIVIVNSHDRTATLQMYAGLFRIVCLNGLIAGDKWGSAKIRHIGDAQLSLDTMIEHTTSIVPSVIDKIEAWQSIRLDSQQIADYEKPVIELVNDGGKWAIPAGELTRVRRYADTERDLYTVFNRAQEAIIRGGYDRQNAAGVWTRARRLTDIKKVVEINRSLWDLTEQFSVAIQ